MKKIKLRNGTIFLDDEEVTELISFNIASSAKEQGIAELTICICVAIDED